MLCFPRRGSFSEQIEELDIPTYYIPYGHSVYPSLKTASDWIKFPFRLIKLLVQNHAACKEIENISEKIEPDIIHTNVGPLDIGYKVAEKIGVRHVWHLREYQDLDFGLHYFPSKMQFVKKIQSSVNFSISITSDIFRYWGLDGNKDKVVYDGVVPDQEHRPIQKKEKCFLFVGRLEDAKGVKSLLNVFFEYAKKDAEYSLHIVGSGTKEYVKECKSLVEIHKMGDRVKFLGYRKDIYALMEAAQVIVVPSRNEGFGFITTEAMYNHCLVIGKNTAGTKEQFDNGLSFKGEEIGFRFESDQELLTAMLNVSKLSYDKYLYIANNAYETVMNYYTIDRHVKNLSSFYNEALG